MTLEELLKKEREIWGHKPQTLEHSVLCLGKVYGDITKQARSKIEQGELDEEELKVELANLITSSIRFIDDLGFDLEECIQKSLTRQQAYKKF